MIRKRTMVGTCKDCEYWREIYDGDVEYYAIWTTCEYIKWPEATDPIGESEAALHAYSSDDNGLEVKLRTGPSFGCTNFEEKVCH
jgi:hypothetical protein